MSVARGFQGQFAVGDTTAAGQGLIDIASEGMQCVYQWIDGNGIKGTRARSSERTVKAELPAGGSFAWAPHASDLVYFLPKITGDTSPAAGLHKLQETLPSFYVVKATSQLTTSNVFRYPGTTIGRTVITCARGSPLMFSCDALALQEEVIDAVPGSPVIDTTDRMWMFHDMTTFTLASVTYECFDWSLSIDHALAFRAINSRITTQIYPTDRMVMFSCTIPYGDVTFTKSTGVLTGPFADVEGVAMAATFNNGTDSLAFAAPKVRFTHATPVMVRGEILYRLTGQCFKSGTVALTNQEVDITVTDV